VSRTESVLDLVLGELYHNASQLRTAMLEVPTDGVPYPLFELGTWPLVSDPMILTTLRASTTTALVHVYNRMRTSNEQCASWAELQHGPSAALIHATVAGRLCEPEVKQVYDQFVAARTRTRDSLLDRLRDLKGFLDSAIDEVEAELGREHATRAAQREFVGGDAGTNARPLGTPREVRPYRN
jgi:hypothetical protein